MNRLVPLLVFFFVLFVGVLLFFLYLNFHSAQEVETRDISTQRLIENAYESGAISFETQWLYFFYAIYEPTSLPKDYYSQSEWSSSMLLAEFNDLVESYEVCLFSASVLSEIDRVSNRNVVSLCNTK